MFEIINFQRLFGLNQFNLNQKIKKNYNKNDEFNYNKNQIQQSQFFCKLQLIQIHFHVFNTDFKTAIFIMDKNF